MKSHPSFDPSHTAPDATVETESAPAYGELPNRLLTAFEVAQFMGCHEETVRRANETRQRRLGESKVGQERCLFVRR